MNRLCEELAVSQRRACLVLGRTRSTQRYKVCVPDNEPRLVQEIIRLVKDYGRYGYRRITGLLRNDGWKVNHIGGKSLNRPLAA